ncbi:MAG: hypothetical protein K8T10_11435 [Candidatus Eremiobacteraeota bacterium]|nr:hypothetical protein [Candidatus Eremiobacteraeota bacterium]
MELEKKEIVRIESFKKWDKLNNIIFVILLIFTVIFIAVNISAIYRLMMEYKISSPGVLSLLNHEELNRNMQWYEVHIMRRLGYVMMGLIIALFFPIFYTMGRCEMKTAVKCYDQLIEKEKSEKEQETKVQTKEVEAKKEHVEEETSAKEPDDG